MGERIVVGFSPVVPFADDLALSDDNRTDGDLPHSGGVLRLLEGLPHPFSVVHSAKHSAAVEAGRQF
jgi:hypothetical protein